jgi:hypothetical protein
MAVHLPRQGIGFLNDLFYDRIDIAGPEEMSIPFLLDEKLIVVAVGSGGERLALTAAGSNLYLWEKRCLDLA